jgi:hypothetical protein
MSIRVKVGEGRDAPATGEGETKMWRVKRSGE